MVNKVKGFPYSLPSVGPGADPDVQAFSRQVTISHPPGGWRSLLSPGGYLPSRRASPPLGRYQAALLTTNVHVEWCMCVEPIEMPFGADSSWSICSCKGDKSAMRPFAKFGHIIIILVPITCIDYSHAVVKKLRRIHVFMFCFV